MWVSGSIVRSSSSIRNKLFVVVVFGGRGIPWRKRMARDSPVMAHTIAITVEVIRNDARGRTGISPIVETNRRPIPSDVSCTAIPLLLNCRDRPCGSSRMEESVRTNE